MKNLCTRIFSMWLTLVIVVGLLPIGAIAYADGAVDVPNEAYLIDDSGLITGIDPVWVENNTPEDGSSLEVRLTIPDNIDGKTITGIGPLAFCSNKDLGYIVTELYFETGPEFKTIDTQAFFGAQINEVTIPDSINVIGRGAFRYCTNLRVVNFEGDPEKILSAAFNGCENIEELNFNSVKTENNIITFPDTLTTLGRQAFKDAFNPDISLVLPGSLVNMGTEAIYDDIKAVYALDYSSDDGYTFISESEHDDNIESGIYDGFSEAAFKVVNDSPIIFKDKATYDVFYNGTSGWMTSYRLTYPMTVGFYVDNPSEYPDWTPIEQEKLYNFSLSYEKNADGYWGINSSYKLPDFPTHNHNGNEWDNPDTWEMGGNEVNVNTRVTSDTILYSPCSAGMAPGIVITPYIRYLKDWSTTDEAVTEEQLESLEFTETNSTQVYFNIKDAGLADDHYYVYQFIDSVTGEGSRNDEKLFKSESYKEPDSWGEYTDKDTSKLSIIKEYGQARHGDEYYTFRVTGYKLANSSGWGFEPSPNDEVILPTREYTIKVSFPGLITIVEYCTDEDVASIISVEEITDETCDNILNTLRTEFSTFWCGVNSYNWDEFEVDWSIDNFDKTPGVKNEFKWEISKEALKEQDLAAADGVSLFGYVAIQNPYLIQFGDEDPIYKTPGSDLPEENFPPIPDDANKPGYDASWGQDGDIEGIDSNLDIEIEYKPIVYDINYLGIENDVELSAPVTYTIEDKVEIPNPIRKGYKFIGWTAPNMSEPVVNLVIPVGTIGDKEYTANWEKESSGSSGGSSGNTGYYITSKAYGNGSIQPSGTVYVSRYSDKTFTITPNDGYEISELIVDGKSIDITDKYTFKNIKEGHKIEVYFKEVSVDVGNPSNNGVSDILDTTNHNAYLVGFTDSTFRPSKNISRAEVAQMIYNLLLDKSAISSRYEFKDVDSNAWYKDAVYALANKGYMIGTSDTTFNPERSITRAEFATVISRFASLDTKITSNYFIDVDPNAWYYDAVHKSAYFGWVVGYNDGRFNPDGLLTRAEAVTIMNRVLGRKPDKLAIYDNVKANRFTDIDSSNWAYYDIIEATYSHKYKFNSDREIWTG